MHDHRNIVLGELHVSLDVLSPVGHGVVPCLAGVLDVLLGAASVGHGDRARA